MTLVTVLQTSGGVFDRSDARALEWGCHFRRSWNLSPLPREEEGQEWEGKLRVYGDLEDMLACVNRTREIWARWVTRLVVREIGGWVVEIGEEGKGRRVKGKVYQ